MSDYKKYQCKICDHIYDEAEGDPDSCIEAGTRWQGVPEPDDWYCPECGVGNKNDYRLLS